MTYLFSNPDNPSETVEVAQGINEKHEYISNGKRWQRIFTPPQLVTQGLKTDPYSSKQFIERTANGGTMGDLWDRSTELAEMREQKDGVDRLAKNGGKPQKDTGIEVIL